MDEMRHSSTMLLCYLLFAEVIVAQEVCIKIVSFTDSLYNSIKYQEYANLAVSYSKVDPTRSPLYVFKDISNALSSPGCHRKEALHLSNPPSPVQQNPSPMATVVITDLTSIAFQYIALECQLRAFVLLSTAEKLRYEVQPLGDMVETIIWAGGVRPYLDNSSLSSILCLVSAINEYIAIQSELTYTVDILLLVDADFVPAVPDGFAYELRAYLEALITSSNANEDRVSPFYVPQMMHLVVNSSDPKDVKRGFNSFDWRLVNEIDAIVVYSKNPDLLFASLVDQDLIQIHASKLWLVPLAVSEHICEKLSLQDVVYVHPRWPAKLIVQCLEDHLHVSPSQVIQMLPSILNKSVDEFNLWREHEEVIGLESMLPNDFGNSSKDRSQKSVKRFKDIVEAHINEVYPTNLHERAPVGESFMFYMKYESIHNTLEPLVKLRPYPFLKIEGFLDQIVCIVQGFQAYGCRSEKIVHRVKVLGIYNPPYWLESDSSESEGCLGVANRARVFTNISHLSNNNIRAGVYRCVDGVGLELVRKLATDVGFKYTINVLNNTNFSNTQNWSLVAQWVQDGVVDIVVGQIPASVHLLKLASFSIPFRYDSLSITVQRRFQGATIDSFLKPLNIFMFVSIGLGVNIAAIAITYIEWQSPYGLTPRGRNRTKVFSLPSGLVLCWSILLGHTIDTSTPKSWGGRWLMNVWAALSVYFVASYTAKLAVHMIGRTTHIELSGIHDPKIESGEVTLGTLLNSYAHNHLETFYREKNIRNLRLYSSLSEAILELQSGKIDGIVWQKGVMEHIVASNFDCHLLIVGKPFATIEYSIMFRKGDLELTTWFNKYLDIYHSNMYIEDMLDKWRKGVQCDSQQIIEPQLSVNHCFGVFLMLLVGVLLGLVGNLLEHIAAKVLLRGRRFYGARAIKIFHPLSQRVHRSVQAEESGMPGMSSIVRSIQDFWKPSSPSAPTSHDPYSIDYSTGCVRRKRKQRHFSSTFSRPGGGLGLGLGSGSTRMTLSSDQSSRSSSDFRVLNAFISSRSSSSRRSRRRSCEVISNLHTSPNLHFNKFAATNHL